VVLGYRIVLKLSSQRQESSPTDSEENGECS
jgi:hypothetical protein